jgi:hypothetical protein
MELFVVVRSDESMKENNHKIDLIFKRLYTSSLRYIILPWATHPAQRCMRFLKAYLRSGTIANPPVDTQCICLMKTSDDDAAIPGELS